MIEVKQNDIEDKQNDNDDRTIWRSCCFEINKQYSLFFSKLLISLLVIALCSYQLVVLADCQYQSLYSSLLSTVITFWLSKK